MGILRVYELIRALGWIVKRGGDYVRIRSRVSDEELSEFATVIRVYDEAGGLFFPFGVRLSRVRRAIGLCRDRWLGWLFLPPLLFIKYSWPWYAFAPAAGTSACLLAASTNGANGSLVQSLLFLASVLLVFGSLSIAAELVLCYLMLGSWITYHSFVIAPNRRTITELSLVAGGALIAYLTSVAATFIASIWLR